MRLLIPFLFLTSTTGVSADICASQTQSYLVPIDVKELICCVPTGPDFPDTFAPPDNNSSGPVFEQPAFDGDVGVFAPTDLPDTSGTVILQSVPQLFGNLDSPLCKGRDELSPIESISLQADPTGGGACRSVEEVLFASCSCTLSCNSAMVCGELCPATRVNGQITGFFDADIIAINDQGGFDPEGIFMGQNKSYFIGAVFTPCGGLSGCDGDFDGTFDDQDPFD